MRRSQPAARKSPSKITKSLLRKPTATVAFFAALPCCAEKRRHTDTAADEQIVRVRVERKAVAEGRQNIHLVADLKLRELLCTRAVIWNTKRSVPFFLSMSQMEIGAAQRFTGHVNVCKLSGLRRFCQFRR